MLPARESAMARAEEDAFQPAAQGAMG